MATTSPDRIEILDVIRGLAVMGILSVNIVGMSMMQQAYFYPPAYGFDGMGDKIMWGLNSILVDGRFRSLFSILFGASMILVFERSIAAGRKPWRTHYPRMIVLLLFGLTHYYVLWWGDILANYAMVGMIAFIFWRLRGKWLIGVTILAFIGAYAPNLVMSYSMIQMVDRVQAGGGTEDEQKQVARMMSEPTEEERQERIEADIAKHASIPAHFSAMTSGNDAMRPFQGVLSYGPETLALMLLGILMYKSGFLTGTWSTRQYTWFAIVCLGIELSYRSFAVWQAIDADFDQRTFFPWIRIYSAPLHAVGATGYIALFVLLFAGRSWIKDRIAAVGRTAFTNYLGPTVITTFVFFGTFGGLYGQLSRGESWLLVPPIWAFMLIWSPWWLERFRYGPFEWAWRSLARWELQPMRLTQKSV